MANKTEVKKDGMEAGQMAAVGAGIAALAAGVYFFLGPDGKKHQKKMKGWMVKMKGEVLEKLEEARDVSEPIYNEIVDTVAKTYTVAGKIPREEIMGLASELKKQWRTISRSAKASKKAPVKKSTASKSKSSTTKKSSSTTSKTSKK